MFCIIKRVSALVLGVVCAVAVGGVVDAARAERTELPGMIAERVADPVLGGEVVRYRGGRDGGPTLVLVHGISEDGVRDWQALIPELLERYRVLALDLPGFGASEAGNRPYDLDGYVAVVRDLVTDHAQGPVTLLGHSMGGAVALRYAGRHPEEVENLLLVSLPGLLNPSSYVDFLLHLGIARDPAAAQSERMPQAEGTLEAWAGRVVRRLTRHTPDAGLILKSDRLREWVLGGDPKLIAGLDLAHTDFSGTLAAVEARTSILWGGDDRVAPVRNGRLLAAHLPGRDLTVLDGVGHMPMSQARGAFHRWVRARMAKEYPEQPLWPPAPPVTGTEVARCVGQQGYHLSGAWERIIIEGCREVVLDRVSAREIRISDATVRMEDPRIHSNEGVALAVDNSQVTLTAGDIRGRIGVSLRGGHLDIAGGRIVGEANAVRIESGRVAELSLSVTRLWSRGEERRYHGVMALRPGDAL